MYNIKIKEINKENWEEATKLSVMPHQKSLVPSITESLAYAYIKPWDEALDPYLIYLENTIIGFFYISYTPGSIDNYWIGGFQIDKAYQGKGYGESAFRKIIEFIKEKHLSCKIISLTVVKENTKAKKLYEKYGFINQSKNNADGEAIYRMRF